MSLLDLQATFELELPLNSQQSENQAQLNELFACVK